MSPTLPPLIPRRLLLGNPTRAQCQISGDGRSLSWLAPLDGVMNVWVAPTGAPGDARAVSRVTGRGISSQAWARDNRHLIYSRDTGGDENWHLVAVDPQSGASRELTPTSGVAARMVRTSRDKPDEIIVGLNDRDRRWHDLWHVRLSTGERRLVRRNTEEVSWYLLDDALNVRLASRGLKDGGRAILRADGERLVEHIAIPHEDVSTTFMIGVNRAGTAWYLASSLDRDTGALYRVDGASGQTQLLFMHPEADYRSAIWDPRTGEPMAASAARLKPEWFPLNAEAKAALDFLSSRLGPEFGVVSQTDDNARWVVLAGGPERPGTYHLYDRPSSTLTELFDIRPDLKPYRLAPMQAQDIRSRDGLTMTSYLTLPAGETKSRPRQPMPLVLLVHGGPQSRDSYGYHPQHQWLANRGYGVLAVNYRGSTGFGKAFVNAGNLEWGRKMHDDLIDAVEWVVREGIAPRDKIAIMGGSYGGYATLCGMAFTPDVFCCGVCIVGPSNLETLLKTIPPYWTAAFETLVRRIGDPRTEAGRALLRERSPLWRASEIKKPLLIAQGANDPRVVKAESDQIVEAMQKNGLPVTYLLYPDEGHGLARPPNRLSYHAIVEAFLERNLGGRSEPYDKDLAGSSLQVPVGAGHVAGLEAALKGAR